MRAETEGMASLAVIMTCHNRRMTTVRCLRRLHTQAGLGTLRVDVILVDDGSTDGTAAAVAAEFPTVRVVPGDGSLYWAGGMRLGMAAAMDVGYDFYLWLNDDTDLDDDALSRLLETYHALLARTGSEPIVVGSLRDPASGELTYGGSVRTSRWHPLRFSRVAPAMDAPIRCDVINGNVVLISRSVVYKVGNLHPAMRHAAGDYEYALRAARHGIYSWVAPGYFGTCARNTAAGTWLEPNLSLLDRYRRLLGPKGYPVRQRAAYMSEHGGILWPLLFAAVYVTLPIRHVAARFARR